MRPLTGVLVLAALRPPVLVNAQGHVNEYDRTDRTSVPPHARATPDGGVLAARRRGGRVAVPDLSGTRPSSNQ